MRYSRQREMVLQAVIGNQEHPTADQIYKIVRKRDPKISLGTVYRNLNQLSEVGELLRIPVSDGKDRFDYNQRSHYHLKCTKCGAFTDLPQGVNNSIDLLLADIKDQTGMNVNPERIQLEGLCKTCSQMKETFDSNNDIMGS